MSESIGQRVARAAWMAMNGDKAWAEMAWNDMGGAEPTWERANLELAVEEALGRDVLHIAGPCEDGETVTTLCGVVKKAESPKSPDQPVCQACSAVQMAERNELNYARESAPDVLAEVRKAEREAIAVWLERPGPVRFRITAQAIRNGEHVKEEA